MHSQLLGFQIHLEWIHLYQSILCFHTCIYYHSNIIVTNTTAKCTFTIIHFIPFYVPCFVSYCYIYLFQRYKEKNTGSSWLTLTICGLTLHSWLFIKIQLNKFMSVKADKNFNPVKKHFLINPSILLYYAIFFHQIIVNVQYIINCNSITINTKIINVPI